MKLIIPNIELSKEIERLRIALWEFEKDSADFSIRIPSKESISVEMSEYFNDTTKKVFLLEEGDKIVGVIYGTIEKAADYIEEYAQTGYIKWIYIEQDFRGKWWWKLLIEAMFNWFKDEDIHLVQLGVLTSNIEAMELYKKLWFQSYYTKMKMII